MFNHFKSLNNILKSNLTSFQTAEFDFHNVLELLRNIFSCELGIFSFKLGKKSPNLHWERGLISAPETLEKNP